MRNEINKNIIYELIDNNGKIIICKQYKNFKLMYSEKKRLEKIKHIKNVSHIIGSKDTKIFLTKIKGKDLYYMLPYLDEYDIQHITYKLLIIVKNLHNINIVHGDIKPENIMYDKYSGNITLIDFEHGRHTNKYISPELIYNFDKFKNYKCIDIWSIGITIYILLTKHHPYNNYKHLLSGLPYHSIINKGFSSECINFIETLLIFEYQTRPNINECLKHKWFNKFNIIKPLEISNTSSNSFNKCKLLCCCIL